MLQSVERRKEAPTHTDPRLRFVSVAKRTSWLNRIEIGISNLVRRVIKRGLFSSATDLRKKVLALINSFHRALAKPFKSTRAGRTLTCEVKQPEGNG